MAKPGGFLKKVHVFCSLPVSKMQIAFVAGPAGAAAPLAELVEVLWGSELLSSSRAAEIAGGACLKKVINSESQNNPKQLYRHRPQIASCINSLSL